MSNKIESFFKPYVGVKKLFSRYWLAYGGWRALIRSPYLHFSFIFSIFSYGLWKDISWVEIPISILPSIIGFSLGGYAIWLALGDEKFRLIISSASDQSKLSPFIQINSAFIHFIVLQFFSLAFALMVKADFLAAFPLEFKQKIASFLPHVYVAYKFMAKAVHFFGYFVFVYALFSALAATMALFRIAHWLEQHNVKLKASKKNDGDSQKTD